MNTWDNIFKDGPVWEFEPADSSILTAKFFIELGIVDVLIPGIGYGRNVDSFLTRGINVEGIEISGVAIDIAREHGYSFPIYHGSVLDMPFNDKKYEGIYCYSLLHLFNQNERRLFLNSCYNQLKDGGFMIFVVASNEVGYLTNGQLISTNRYKLTNGLTVYLYDMNTIEEQFKPFGLVDYSQIIEPIKYKPDEVPLKCFFVACKKITQ